MAYFLKNLSIAIALIILWQLIITANDLPFYILPSPYTVALIFKNKASLILWHLGISLYEILLGLFLGLVLGVSSAIAIDRFHYVRLLLQPLVICLQSIPMFALMPVLLIWFGYGLLPKIVVVALSCYFPITLCFIDGFKNTPPELIDMAAIMKATPWQFFKLIKFPAALPSLMSGIRVAAVHAPVTVIAADWIGASDGLGYLIMLTHGRMELDFMFACIICLILMSTILNKVLKIIQRKLIFWTPEA